MIILIGESGSGKSTIEKELVNRGFTKITSYTTRPMRNGEIDGVDYHFIANNEFKKLLSEDFFAEHTCYNDWLYGIAKKDCDTNSVVVVEPHGFRQLKQIDNLNLTSFYIKVSQKERLTRLAKRDDRLMEIFRRILTDQGLFQGIESEIDYIVDGEKSTKEIVDKIMEIMRGR